MEESNEKYVGCLTVDFLVFIPHENISKGFLYLLPFEASFDHWSKFPRQQSGNFQYLLA